MHINSKEDKHAHKHNKDMHTTHPYPQSQCIMLHKYECNKDTHCIIPATHPRLQFDCIYTCNSSSPSIWLYIYLQLIHTLNHASQIQIYKQRYIWRIIIIPATHTLNLIASQIFIHAAMPHQILSQNTTPTASLSYLTNISSHFLYFYVLNIASLD